MAEVGEYFGPGAPLRSLVDLNDVSFTFNIREDLLAGLKVDDTLMVQVPALNHNGEVSAHVTTINAQGQYATWRATKATGDFDLRTFEARAETRAAGRGTAPRYERYHPLAAHNRNTLAANQLTYEQNTL